MYWLMEIAELFGLRDVAVVAVSEVAVAPAERAELEVEV